LLQPRRDDADRQGPPLELGDDVPDTAGQTQERRELREGLSREPVGLEPVLDLARHHLKRLLLDEGDRVELRVEDSRDRVGLRETTRSATSSARFWASASSSSASPARVSSSSRPSNPKSSSARRPSSVSSTFPWCGSAW